MDSQTWDRRPLREAVRSKYGDEAFDSLKDPTTAIRWKMNMGNYHAGWARRVCDEALDEIANPSEPRSHVAVMALMSGNPHLIQAVEHAEFHTIAAAQALHSIADISGLMIYRALCLGKLEKAPKEDRLNISKVRDFLGKSCEYTVLHELIEGYLNSVGFCYLSAYVNTTKHRSLVPTNSKVELSGSQTHHLLNIKAFEYNDRTWDAVWADDFVTCQIGLAGQWVLSIDRAIREFIGD